MTTISERLRRLSETGANIVSDPLDLAAREAADTIDALVAALEVCKACGLIPADSLLAESINTALAKAKGKQE